MQASLTAIPCAARPCSPAPARSSESSKQALTSPAVLRPMGGPAQRPSPECRGWDIAALCTRECSMRTLRLLLTTIKLRALLSLDRAGRTVPCLAAPRPCMRQRLQRGLPFQQCGGCLVGRRQEEAEGRGLTPPSLHLASIWGWRGGKEQSQERRVGRKTFTPTQSQTQLKNKGPQEGGAPNPQPRPLVSLCRAPQEKRPQLSLKL